MSEYWIQNDGSVDFADGDVGEQNHESIVINSVQRTIIDKCQSKYKNLGHNFDNGDYVDWDEFKTALVKAYAPIFYKSRPLFTKAWVKHQTNYDPQAYEWSAARLAGVQKDEWDCAEGVGDARDYAMSKWAWKTYRGGNIDTWRMSRSDLQAIISGLEEIAESEGWSEKKLNKSSFSINVFSNKKHFSLSFAQMKRWLEKPQEVPPIANQNFQYGPEWTSAASKNIRDIELQNIHPFYRRPGSSPFGDSTFHSFKTFMEAHHKELHEK